MIKKIQIAGIKLAKQKGMYQGKVKKYTEQHAGMKQAINLHRQTMKEICTIMVVSHAVLYRKLRELNKDKKTIF